MLLFGCLRIVSCLCYRIVCPRSSSDLLLVVCVLLTWQAEHFLARFLVLGSQLMTAFYYVMVN